MGNYCWRNSWIGRYWGPVLLTVSAILFAAMAVVVRLAGYHGIPGSQSTLVRFAFGILTVAGMHLLGFTRLTVRRPKWLVARGITGGLAILFYFLSLSYTEGPGATTLTNSVLLSNSYFVFTPLFGALLIQERVRPTTIVAVFVALVGMYLVINPKFGGIRTGDVLGLTSGIMAGLAIVTVRELRKTESAPVVFLALCAIGLVMSSAIVVVEGAALPDWQGWIMLLTIAAISTGAQLILTHAFKFVPAGEGSLIAMTTIVYASLASIFLFHEPITLLLLIGAVLVFASAGYIALTQNGGQVE
ncbi:MAG: DMT family transporter [Armatimonadetes bacterium]|nr:DMT family transporter [Armatimonadota bacterium]